MEQFFDAKYSAHYVLFLTGLALLAAWVAESIFGLAPCTLCMYQRYLSVAVILVLGLHLFVFDGRFLKFFLFVTLLLLLSNAGVALYQVGVEQHLIDVPKVCSRAAAAGSFEEFRSRVMSRAMPSCDEIQFSLFGVSMAGYNAILSIFLSILAMRGLLNVRRKPRDVR